MEDVASDRCCVFTLPFVSDGVRELRSVKVTVMDNMIQQRGSFNIN